jgi:hypothetical protein
MGNQNLKLAKYSVGTGDRFAHQAKAQLQACIQALASGVEVVPVWNKSNREHTIIGSEPSSTRQAADAAVKALGWKLPYFVDADHITLKTVDRFLDASDFYTIDVADFIGQASEEADIDGFVKRHPELLGSIHLDGTNAPLEITQEDLRQAAHKYLTAVKKAGEVYRKVASIKGKGNFISEVSMDETETPQSPAELLIILAAIADEGIPVQTIAPKFSGRFNKGVDYVGDLKQFEREFALDIAAIAYAVKHFGLPNNLKLSIHSGSDKFSIYPVIHSIIKRFDAGVPLKTAGGVDRSCGSRWRRAVAGKGYLRRSFCAQRGALRTLRHCYRHQFDQTAVSQRSEGLVFRPIHLRLAPCGRIPSLQQQSAPVAACRLQGRGRHGRPLSGPARIQ